MASVCIEGRDLDEVMNVDVCIEFVVPIQPNSGIQSALVEGRKILYVPDDPRSPESVEAVVTRALNEAMNRGANKVALSPLRREWTNDVYVLEAADEEMLATALAHPINSVIVAGGYNRQVLGRLRKQLLG